MKFHVLCAGVVKIYAGESTFWGVGTRAALIWRVFISEAKFNFVLCHATIFCMCHKREQWVWVEPSTKKERKMCSDEAKLKRISEGWEGNRVNRRQRYKNKKYCARKVLIVFFCLRSTLPTLSSISFIKKTRSQNRGMGERISKTHRERAGNVSYIHPARFNERYAMINLSLEKAFSRFIYSAWDMY